MPISLFLILQSVFKTDFFYVLCLHMFIRLGEAMDQNKQLFYSKNKLQHMLGETKTSYEVLDRQVKARDHPDRLRDRAT